jgi:Ran GTPase-activating protein (RanGAP) involved in mRNA processing and transport
MRPDVQDKIKNSQFQQINLENMNITDDEMEEIVREIKQHNEAVKHVFLNNNKIGDKAAQIISKEFGTLQHLAYIDLQFNDIDKEGILSLLKLRKDLPAIQLALHGNRVVYIQESEF